MTKREMTCIICPMGCSLTVEMEGEEITSISGNTCKRGAAYAEAEVEPSPEDRDQYHAL